MTLLAVILLIYVSRRPLIWISLRVLAFTIGFIINWRFMERR